MAQKWVDDPWSAQGGSWVEEQGAPNTGYTGDDPNRRDAFSANGFQDLTDKLYATIPGVNWGDFIYQEGQRQAQAYGGIWRDRSSGTQLYNNVLARALGAGAINQAQAQQASFSPSEVSQDVARIQGVQAAMGEKFTEGPVFGSLAVLGGGLAAGAAGLGAAGAGAGAAEEAAALTGSLGATPSAVSGYGGFLSDGWLNNFGLGNPSSVLTDAGDGMAGANGAGADTLGGGQTFTVGANSDPSVMLGGSADPASLPAWQQSGGSTLASLLKQYPTLPLSAAQLISSAISASTARNAGQQVSNAANNATAMQQGMFDTLNAQGAPFRQAGVNALGPIMSGFGLGPESGGVSQGQFNHQFGPQDLKSNLAPNYEFMLGQGLGAQQNFLNTKGGLVSGNTLKGITDYAENYASNAYQNAFENYQSQQNNIFNRLSTVAGFGQTANQTTAGAGASIAPAAAQTQVGAAQANASGNVGAANALSNGLTNAASWYALPDIMKSFGAGGGAGIKWT